MKPVKINAYFSYRQTNVMTNMTSTVASTNNNAATSSCSSAFVAQPVGTHPKPLSIFGNNGKEIANYAVVKLKSSDSLVSLFQLLLQHGYNQVSFVNSLNETIFPFVAKFEKFTQTAAGSNEATLGQNSSQLIGSTVLSSDLNLSALALATRPPNVDSKRCVPTPSSFASSLSGITFEQALNSLALDLLPPAARFGQLAALPSSLPAAAAAFLGLPTVPSVFGPSLGGTPASSLFPPPPKGFECLAPPASVYSSASSTTSDVHLALKRKINENAQMLASEWCSVAFYPQRIRAIVARFERPPAGGYGGVQEATRAAARGWRRRRGSAAEQQRHLRPLHGHQHAAAPARPARRRLPRRPQPVRDVPPVQEPHHGQPYLQPDKPRASALVAQAVPVLLLRVHAQRDGQGACCVQASWCHE